MRICKDTHGIHRPRDTCLKAGIISECLMDCFIVSVYVNELGELGESSYQFRVELHGITKHPS